MIQKPKKVDIIFSPYSVAPYQILKDTMKRSKEEIIAELISSGLRGRGGAGFPTGMKWKFAAEQKGDVKYVICNADEGEPGTSKDRKLLVEVPRKVISGMAICAWVTGAKLGFIYLRREYKYLVNDLQKELDIFKQISKEVGLDFNIQIFLSC